MDSFIVHGAVERPPHFVFVFAVALLLPLLSEKTASPSQSFLLHNFYLFAMNEDMREHNYLGEFELMVLLTILRLGDEAYGVPLSRELTLMRGREVAIGSVYAALDRLEIKGLIASSLGESTPERGGRAKRYFRVTQQGLRSIHETRKVLSKLWKSLPSPQEELA
jgi:DNA-binding PadR family transcriptional regulator